MRDLNQVKDKLRVVLMPINQESEQNVLQKLRDCKFCHFYFNFFFFSDFIIIIIF